jgi:hypothetical protein
LKQEKPTGSKPQKLGDLFGGSKGPRPKADTNNKKTTNNKGNYKKNESEVPKIYNSKKVNDTPNFVEIRTSVKESSQVTPVTNVTQTQVIQKSQVAAPVSKVEEEVEKPTFKAPADAKFIDIDSRNDVRKAFFTVFFFSAFH